MTPGTKKVLEALRAKAQGATEERAGSVWREVFTADAARAAGISRHAFAGHLSALAAAGLYEAQLNDFGLVRL